MIETVQISQLILSISLFIIALKKDFSIATIIMVLLFVTLYFIK